MATAQAEGSNVDQLRAEFEAHGQQDVFRFWDSLDTDAREGLLRQAGTLDLSALLRGYRAACDASGRAPALEPIAVEALPEHGGDPARRELALARGEALLRAGRVGVMVVAGGQATRLGYPGPKGLFPLGPVSQRCLFEQQAQKLRRLRARWGRAIPWYVMTSPATDAPTRQGFESARHFGLPAEDVFILSQAMVPSIDFEGRLMLEQPGQIFENPDGHGGALTALLASGALDDMARRGIDTLFYYQVDNPLVPLADALFVGFHALAEAEMSCKVIRKCASEEKVGVVARVDGRVGVVEYTEIDDTLREARDAAGDLVYWAGNMAVHVFETDFVRRVARDAETLLPYHVSAKKIPTVAEDGSPYEPTEPNGHKLERFVFDALAAARAACIVEVRREEEYSPVKNAEGGDSPATARRDLSHRYRAWLAEAGAQLPPEDIWIELDESHIADADDVRSLGIRQVGDGGDAVRTGPGVEA